MSNFKVSKQKISLFTHPNADSLSLGKVGSYQVVVQKGLYNDGDEVVFAPEKSVLTGQIKTEFEKYLVGPNQDRVKSVRLRGEISSGIIIPRHLVPDFDNVPIDEDISELVGITKYEPPIPAQLAGKVKSFDMPFIGHHDCEHAGVYVNELVDGERVVISEKVHGSQFILAHNVTDGSTIISSKGLLKKGLTLDEEDTNFYWRAAKNDGIVDKIRSNWTEGIVQVFGEGIPIQSGYTYGQTDPTVRIFDVRVNGVSIPYDQVPEDFRNLWVPVIFDGTLNLEKKEVVIYSDPEKGIHKTKTDYLLPKEIVDMCKGNETVSGKSLHIREGVVLRPYVDRLANDGTQIRLKIINPAYKESGEEIN
jgi:RNA ligase (TIGR02306 family)